MTLNNVSALGSIVDALILCNCDMTIGGHNYQAGEPFTYLRQVTVNIESQSASPQATTLTPSNRGMQLVDAVNYLNRLAISNVSMTNKIKSLFFNPAENKIMTEWKPVLAVKTKLEHADAFNSFVYEEGILLPVTRYTIEDGWLTIADFDEVKHYNICYSHNEALSSFVVENYPYFKIILLAQGNVNGKTSDQRLVFEKVSLMPQTQFTFAAATQNNVTLVFGIIEPDKTVAVKI